MKLPFFLIAFVSFFTFCSISSVKAQEFSFTPVGGAIVEDTMVYSYGEVSIKPTPNFDIERYFFKKLNYPRDAFNREISAEIWVTFIVNKDGTTSNHKVLNEEDKYGFSKEALKLIKGFPKFNPGKKDGKTVRCMYKMPIYFKFGNDISK